MATDLRRTDVLQINNSTNLTVARSYRD